MSLFADILDEWGEYHLDSNLSMALRLMEAGLDPEPQVQDYDKFHGAVRKAQDKTTNTHFNLHSPDTKFKNRKHKRDSLASHHKRLGKIAQASDIAARFSRKVGKHDDAEGHENAAKKMRDRQSRMNLDVPGKKR